MFSLLPAAQPQLDERQPALPLPLPCRILRLREERPKGVDLLPIMLEIIGWSAKHDPRTAADRRFVRRLRTDRDGLMAELGAELKAGQANKLKEVP